jgi:hypothetical protein
MVRSIQQKLERIFTKILQKKKNQIPPNPGGRFETVFFQDIFLKC